MRENTYAFALGAVLQYRHLRDCPLGEHAERSYLRYLAAKAAPEIDADGIDSVLDAADDTLSYPDETDDAELFGRLAGIMAHQAGTDILAALHSE